MIVAEGAEPSPADSWLPAEKEEMVGRKAHKGHWEMVLEEKYTKYTGRWLEERKSTQKCTKGHWARLL